jgi:hypothetical protein
MAAILLVGFFLFAEIKFAKAQTYLNSYSKPWNGTLSATEWNNLPLDFVNRNGSANMTGPLVIGSAATSSSLTVYGPISATFNAANISAGEFGSNTGFGNFLFGATGPGNVGIGTTTANYKLNVQGDINLTGNLLRNGVPFWGGLWSSNGSSIYYNSGNVGIGTSNPGATFNLSGDYQEGGYYYKKAFESYFTTPANQRKYISFDTPISGWINGTIVITVFSNTGNASVNGFIKKTIALVANESSGVLTLPGTSTMVDNVVGYLGSAIVIGDPEVNGTTVRIPITHLGTNRGVNIQVELYGRVSFVNVFKNVSLTAEEAGTAVPRMFNTIERRLGINLGNNVMPISALQVGGNALFSGNVGIGTTTPTAKLHIDGGTGIINTGVTQLTALSGAGNVMVMADNTGTLYSVTSPSGTITLPAGLSGQTLRYDGSAWVANSNLFNSGANVGIGTTEPFGPLEVFTGDNSNLNAVSVHRNSASGGQHVGYGFSINSGNNGFKQSIAAVRTGGWGVGDLAFILNSSQTSGNATLADERMRITSAGNVGIGTTNPSARLHVVGASGIINTGVTQFTPLGGAGNVLVMADNTGTLYSVSSPSGSVILPAGTSGATLRHDGTNWISNTNLFNNGTNVGIGTTNPTQTLEIIGTMYTGSHNNYGDSDFVWSQYSGYAGAVKGGLKMRNGGGTLGTGIMFRQTVRRYANTDLVSILTSTTPDSADFYISTTHNDSNTEKLRIKSSGEIGIGTSAPNARLTVNGNTVLGGATQISPLGGAGSVLVMADNDGTLYATSSSALLPPGSATLPPGISGQTLRHDGTVWTADSNLFNDGANVGIGTTIPRTRLSLGTAGENAASSKISVYENGNITYGIGLARGNTYGLGLYAASTMTGAPRVFVEATGNVGINTTAPNARLTVNGNTILGGATQISPLGGIGNALVMTDNAGNLYSTSTSAVIPEAMPAGTSGATLRHDGTNWISNTNLFNNGTNIGIGTTTPESPIHIDKNGGGIRMTGGDGGRYTIVDASSFRMYSTTVSSGASWSQGLAHYDNDGNLFGTSAGAFGSTNNLIYYYYGGSVFSPHMVIRNSNVGIETKTPNARLTVNGNTVLGGATQISPLGGAGNVMIMADNTGTLYSTSTAAIVSPIVSSASGWTASGTTVYKTDNNGNVGIGITNPSSPLHIFSTTEPQLRVQNRGASNGLTAGILFGVTSETNNYQQAGIFFERTGGTAEGNLHFATKNSGSANATKADAKMTITALGNVGVGTTAPVTRFEVNGNIGYRGGSVIYPRTQAVDDWFLGKFIGSPTVGIDNALGTGNEFRIGKYVSGVFTPNVSLSGGLAGLNSYFLEGNIGIGVTNPSAKLTVNGNTILGGATQITPLGGAGQVLVMADNTGTLYATSSSALLPPGSATLPSGISGQTLRHDGSVWLADSNLFNDGTNVGVGVTNPEAKLDLVSPYNLSGNTFGIRSVLNSLNSASGNTTHRAIYGEALKRGYYSGSHLLIGVQGVAGRTSYAGWTESIGVLGRAVYNENHTYSPPTHNGNSRMTGVKSEIAVTYANTGTDHLKHAYGFYASGVNVAGTNVENWYGLYISPTVTSSGGTVTNSFGIFQEQNSASNYFAGNVGIGITNPNARLTVNGNTVLGGATQITPLGGAGQVLVMADNTGTLYSTSTAAIISPIVSSASGWTASGTTVYKTDNSGNVGIGTTNPNYKLDVNGDFRASGNNFSWNAQYTKQVAYRVGTNSNSRSEVRIPWPNTSSGPIILDVEVMVDTNSVGSRHYIKKRFYLTAYTGSAAGTLYSQDSYVTDSLGGNSSAYINIGNFENDTANSQIILPIYAGPNSPYEKSIVIRAWGTRGIAALIEGATFHNNVQTGITPPGRAVVEAPPGDDFVFYKNVGIGTTNPGAYNLYVNGTSYFNDTLNLRTDYNRPIKNYFAQSDLDSFINIDDNMTTAEVAEALGRGTITAGITKVDDPTAPAPGVFEVSAPIQIYSNQLLKVDQDSEYIFETWVKVVSSTATNQRFLAGWTMYDADKNSFGNNQRYWGAVNEFDSDSYNDGEWHRVVGRISGVGSLTGQFINGTEYVRILLLFNYNSGDTVTRYAGMKLYKSKKLFSSVYIKNGYFNSIDYDGKLVIDANANIFANNFQVGGTTQITPLGGAGNTIVMADNTGTLYSAPAGSSVLPTGTSGATIRHDGTNWISNTNLFNDGTNVGIGTSTPSFKLDIVSNTHTLSRIRGGASHSASLIFDSGSTNSWGLMNGYVNGGRFQITRGAVGAIPTQVVMSFDSSSNVGIGTPNPSARLSVNGNTILGGATQISALGGGGNLLVMTDNAGNLYSTSTSAVIPEAMPIGTSGQTIRHDGGAWVATSNLFNTGTNVGIGTTNPGHSLHINQSGASTTYNYIYLSHENIPNSRLWIGNSSSDNSVTAFQNNNIFESYTPMIFSAALSNNYLSFGTGRTSTTFTETMRMTGGNVGIGTSAPSTRLTVNGATLLGGATQISPLGGAGQVLVMADNTGTLYATSSSALLPPGSVSLPSGTSGQTLRHNGSVWTAASNLYNNGTNVGIGTTNPLASLHIDGGYLIASGGIRVRNYTQIMELPNSSSDNTWYYLGRISNNDGGFRLLAVAEGVRRGANSGGNGVLTLFASQYNGVNTIQHSYSGAVRDNLTGYFAIYTDGTHYYLYYLAKRYTAPTLRFNSTYYLLSTPVAQEPTGDLVYTTQADSTAYLQGNLLGKHIAYTNNDSASTPAYTWIGDEDLGIFRPAADNLAIATQGIERFRINASGRVIINDVLDIANSASATSTGQEVLILRTATNSTIPGSGAILNFGHTNNNATLGQIRSFTETSNRVALAFSTYNTGLSEKMRITAVGNVGIGITNPSARLTVNGNTILGGATQITPLGGAGNVMVMADNTGTLYATTTAILAGDYLSLSGGTMAGDINLGGNDISNINKLTVNTIDPLYRIKGVNYSSFAAAIVGGVKEEYVGKAQINKLNFKGEYEFILDFAKQKEGSDLWVWYKTVDFSAENVDALVTNYGNFAQVYYLIEGEKLIFRASEPTTISYRLIGRRHDWRNWPTRAIDQNQTAGFVID